MKREVKVGDHVVVTKSEYKQAAPVGTKGTVTSINDDRMARYSVDRDDGGCEECELID